MMPVWGCCLETVSMDEIRWSSIDLLSALGGWYTAPIKTWEISRGIRGRLYKSQRTSISDIEIWGCAWHGAPSLTYTSMPPPARPSALSFLKAEYPGICTESSCMPQWSHMNRCDMDNMIWYGQLLFFFFFLLWYVTLFTESPSLCRFKADRDEIWRDCSSNKLKYASIVLSSTFFSCLCLCLLFCFFFMHNKLMLIWDKIAT